MPKAPITGKEISDALLAARALMNDRGTHWLRGQMRRTKTKKVGDETIKEVSYCSVGAIREVTKGQPALRKAVLAQLADDIRSSQWMPAKPEDRVMNWNDVHARSWGDISRVFRTAARRALKAK